MGRISKFFSMKRSHESTVDSSVKKTTTFKKSKVQNIKETLTNLFRRQEKEKFAELIDKYTTKNPLQTPETESMKKKEVDEFTQSIRANESQLGLPSSSSTPFRHSVRSNNGTLNSSSFDVINNSFSFNSSSCAVQINPVSYLDELNYRKEIEAAKAKKSLGAILDKSKSRRERVESTLFKYQGKGDIDHNKISNGHCFFAADLDQSMILRWSGRDETVSLNDTITLDGSNYFGPNSSRYEKEFGKPVWRIQNEEEQTQTLDDTIRSSRYSSPLRTESHYHTPRYALNQKTASPVSIALNQSSSQRRLIHKIEEQLSQNITSPFASRSSPPIDEKDLSLEKFKQSIPEIELPEATTKFQERQEELNHAMSPHFVLKLLKERDEDVSVLETSRHEAQDKYGEESRKTADIERQLRAVTLEPLPPEPFIPEFFKGVTGFDFSDEEEEEEDEEETEELRPSLEELDSFIEANVKNSPDSKELINKFSIPITRKDLDTLKGLNWLNDEVMNFYFNLIQERSNQIDNYPNVYVFNTFFSSKLSGNTNGVTGAYGMVKRWTRKVDIFSYDIILIPNHIQVHWTLTAVNIRKKKISYYDSMADGLINSKGSVLMKTILEYLELEHRDKKKSPLPEGWCIGVKGVDDDGNKEVAIPQQENGSDCGVFSCQFAESIARRSPFKFHQSQMPYLRKRMIYEICHGKLET